MTTSLNPVNSKHLPQLDAVERVVRRVADAKRVHEDAVRHLQGQIADARQDLIAIVRSLAEVEDEDVKFRAVRYLYENKAALGVRSKDLAFVMFGDQGNVWHLRKALAPQVRECVVCHKNLPCGWQFDVKRDFVCDPCRKECHARDLVRYRQEDEQRRVEIAAREKAKRDRLNALESRVRWLLSPDDLDELARLRSDKRYRELCGDGGPHDH
jgi:hypothetical protein